MGKGGKLGLGVKSVHLADNEKARARSFEVSAGNNSAAGSILPLAHGKDVVLAQGTEITVYIDGNVHLKRPFQPRKNAVAPAPAVSNPPQLL